MTKREKARKEYKRSLEALCGQLEAVVKEDVALLKAVHEKAQKLKAKGVK